MDLATLIACGVEPTIARRFYAPLMACFQRWAIDEPIERAMFVAQAIHESGGFVRMEESFHWKTATRLDAFFSKVKGTPDAEALIKAGPKAIANRIYGGRADLGNGDEASGDGWNFRGRGIFQLTGRDNYMRAAMGCHRPYETMPDLVANVEDGCTAAGWLWRDKKCGVPARAGDVDEVTRRINPGMAGAKERRELFDDCRRAFRLNSLGNP